MVTFLFWNINKKPLTESIVRLADRHNVDVLILAECEIEPATLLMALNTPDYRGYTYPFSENERLHVYTRFASDAVRAVSDGPHMSARRISVGLSEDLLLIAVHLRSKLYQRDDSQLLAGAEFARDVVELEERVQHQRTLIVGDLNMNPFESAVVGANGLHATMSRQVALQGSRAVGGRDYGFFYNPTWGLLGDLTDTPPGTYYYRNAEHVCYFWNVFDQVLLRPELAKDFARESLAVLDSDGEHSLLRTNRNGVEEPHPSDHLPIVFGLKTDEEESNGTSR